MNAPARMEEWAREQVAAGHFPGVSWLVSEDGRVLAEGVQGHAVTDPERIAVTPGTLFDLASLTKPLATAYLVMTLRQAGALRLDDPLARHLPGWAVAGERAGITLLDLLTHRSGLPAWAPLYIHASGRDERIAWLAHSPLRRPPGEEVVYSCLGYILLGFAIERITGVPLDRLFEERVAHVLGVRDVGFRPPPEWRRRTAATERGNERERRLAGPLADRYNAWRTAVIWGEVHDNNARTQDGVAGNAGLFGTARGVLALARETLEAGRGLLDEESRGLLLRNLTAGLGEGRSAGFQIASSPGSAAGPGLSPRAAGHTGFTGTSLWIDPDSRRIHVLLTNRVHPVFRDLDMNRIRREFHLQAAGL